MNDFVRKKVLYYKRKFDTSDPFKLADLLGIEVMTCDIGSRLGCYMYMKRSKCIWINECLEGNERLFVMAHELGTRHIAPERKLLLFKKSNLSKYKNRTGGKCFCRGVSYSRRSYSGSYGKWVYH